MILITFFFKLSNFNKLHIVKIYDQLVEKMRNRGR